MHPLVIAPRGVWQGARLGPDGSFALMDTTVSPGSHFEDYESGRREALVDLYPQLRHLIIALTK